MRKLGTKIIRLLAITALVGTLAIVLNPNIRAFAASSAQTSANAICTIIASIGISKVTDLDFGNAAPGDASATVDPSTGGASRASFTVTGLADAAYDITLPADSTIIMITGAGDTDDRKISVDSFASSPSGSGTLTGGTETLYVGATRAAIAATQEAGDYTASFNVTVAYQ